MSGKKKPLVVVTRKLPDAVETRMRELFDTRLNTEDRPMTQPELLAAMKDADVLVPTITDRIDAGVAALDLVAASSLQFEAPDNEAFPALGLAFDAARQGVAATTVLNAANEVAVSAFLQGQIGFLRIADVIEGTLQHDVGAAGGDLAERLELDARARRMAADLVRKWPTEREGAVR